MRVTGLEMGVSKTFGMVESSAWGVRSDSQERPVGYERSTRNGPVLRLVISVGIRDLRLEQFLGIASLGALFATR